MQDGLSLHVCTCIPVDYRGVSAPTEPSSGIAKPLHKLDLQRERSFIALSIHYSLFNRRAIIKLKKNRRLKAAYTCKFHWFMDFVPFPGFLFFARRRRHWFMVKSLE